jgi:hypothetical protein
VGEGEGKTMPLGITLPLSQWLDLQAKRRRESKGKPVDTRMSVVCGISEDRRLARQVGNRVEARARKGENNG